MLTEIYLIRHGETTWSESGQHTGTTDLPLTENGKQEAGRLAKRLKNIPFDAVFVSPLRRAKETCECAGLFQNAIITMDAMEWNYGDYEGKTTEEVHRKNPGWDIFLNGAPGGETPAQIGERADKLLHMMLQKGERIALFSHGHFLRALAARWLGLPPKNGIHLLLSTGSISILGYERDFRVISLWNETRA